MKKRRKNLFKYGSMDNPEHLRQILLDNELFFSNPTSFNDPFEWRPRISIGETEKERKQEEQYLKSLFLKNSPNLTPDENDQKVNEFFSNPESTSTKLSIEYGKIIAKYGVYCFSEKNNCLLMWAHYAKSHTGYCLEFNTDRDETFFNTIRKVKYRKQYPTIKYPAIMFSELNFEKAGEKSCLTKSKEWKYEEERRLMKKCSGKHSFPPMVLTGLILGCRMEEPNINIIRKWVSQRAMPIKLKQAQMDDKKYKLKISLYKD